MDIRVLRLSRSGWEDLYFAFMAFDYLGAKRGVRPELPEGYGDDLEIAVIEGLATGYGTLTEASWERAMTLTLSLETAIRTTFGLSDYDICELLERFEGQASALFANKMPHLKPLLLPREGSKIELPRFFGSLLGIFQELGSPSQHIGMIGPYWRGGAYLIEEDHPAAVLRSRSAKDASEMTRLTHGEWLQLLKIRSDGWVEARKVDPVFGLQEQDGESTSGWIEGNTLLTLSTKPVWLPRTLGYSKEGIETLSSLGVLPSPSSEQQGRSPRSAAKSGCLSSVLILTLLATCAIGGWAALLGSRREGLYEARDGS